MCGIAGAFHPNRLNNAIAHEMVDALSHRGPDETKCENIYKNQSLIASVGVTRLSIVSPENGQQPIVGPRFTVCLNGEIYNHQSLRREVLANGFSPLNDSDSAVVAALCELFPLKLVLKRLRGMFAMSIVDNQTGTLWLIRDRMGQKPLYWGQRDDNTLLWASELRALTSQPGLNLTRDDDAIAAFLMLEYIPAPMTPYQGIHKLEAGHLLQMTTREIKVERWWTPPQIGDESIGI